MLWMMGRDKTQKTGDVEGKYDIGMMETLVEFALQSVEEDKDARPTMSQVVEMHL